MRSHLSNPQLKNALLILILVAFLALFLIVSIRAPFGVQDTAAYPIPVTGVINQALLAYPVATSQNGPAPIPPTASSSLNHRRYFPQVFREGITPSRKKGVTWTYGTTKEVEELRVRWYHHWGTSSSGTPNGVEFVPLIWCEYGTTSAFPNGSSTSNQVNLIQNAIANLGSNYNGYLLILNEPNFFHPTNKQCDKHPKEAANIYVKIREAFPYAKIIGPNLAEGSYYPLADYRPIPYMNVWREEVFKITGNYPEVGWTKIIDNKQVSFPGLAGYALHSYQSDHEETKKFLKEFQSAMQKWGASNKELWLTEFGFCKEWLGPNNDPKYHINQMNSLIPALESAEFDFVTRYSYYTTRQVKFDPSQPTPSLGQPTPTPESWQICDCDLYTQGGPSLSIRGETYRMLGLSTNK